MPSESVLELTTWNTLLPSLAVVGRADCGLLLAIAMLDTGEYDCTHLSTHPAVAVVEDKGELVIDATFAASLLQALEADNFLHFRQLHERALHLLGQRLLAGEKRQAVAFQAVVVRLAERLINQAPQELADLIASLRAIPAPISTQHYFDLFAAIALRNLEHYGEALAALEQILTQPVLDADVRGRAQCPCYHSFLARTLTNGA